MANQTKGCSECGTAAPKNVSSDVCPDCKVSYEEKKVCDHCGYSAFGRFMNDTCPECSRAYWRCGKCSRIVSAVKPPEVCPACKEKCDFQNITCYTPECGGPGNIDYRL